MPKNKRSRLDNLGDKPDIKSNSDIENVSKSTRTTHFGIRKAYLTNFQKNINMNIIAVLSIFIDRCQIFDHIHLRIISMFAYMLLRYIGIPYEQCRE